MLHSCLSSPKRSSRKPCSRHPSLSLCRHRTPADVRPQRIHLCRNPCALQHPVLLLTASTVGGVRCPFQISSVKWANPSPLSFIDAVRVLERASTGPLASTHSGPIIMGLLHLLVLTSWPRCPGLQKGNNEDPCFLEPRGGVTIQGAS